MVTTMERLRSQKLFAFLEERSAEIIGGESIKKALDQGKRMRVKLGVDPTNPNLHLGHVVPLRILRFFQDAGHRAVLIIGDFTGQIGDPSGRDIGRRQLTSKEAKANERTYKKQIGKVLDLRRLELRHNSEWYKKMRLADFLWLLANFSLRSVWEREDFQKRIVGGMEVRLHEAAYQVLQAYDSVMVEADLEIGSLDQKLNIMAGRELQRKMSMAPQSIVLTPYLLGLGGGPKMSKSLGNTINLNDPAEEMFGKVMSIPDALIGNYALLAAWLTAAEVKSLEKKLGRGANPRDVKLDIAEAVARLYHGVEKSRRARENFLKVFSKKELSGKFPRVKIKAGSYRPVDLVLVLKGGISKSSARRLVQSRALEVDGRVAASAEGEVAVRSGSVVRIGKKNFFRID